MKYAAILLCTFGLFALHPAEALTVMPETDPAALADALTAGASGLQVLSFSLSGHAAPGGASTGTYTNDPGIYGIAPGIVLSTGDVSQYGDGLNDSTATTREYNAVANAAQEALLDPISGGGFIHHDVTQFDIGFTTATGIVQFMVVFGSEEYDEFVGSQFVDAFGIYLDGVNIADVDGKPVNINHPGMRFHAGTELDGLLAPGGDPLLVFTRTGLDAGPHLLTFIIADTSDDKWDSTVYVSGLGASPVPLPAAVWLFSSGLAGLLASARRR